MPGAHSISYTLLSLGEEHREALETVRDLRRDRREVLPAGLLEVRELRDLHPVEEHLPAHAPRAERRRLPVVLLEAEVVLLRVDPEGDEALDVEVLDVGRSGLDHDLELLVLDEPERVLSVTPVRRAARGLDEARAPGLGPEDAQERGRVHRPGADLDVPRLLDEAAPGRPVGRELQDQGLQVHGGDAECTESAFSRGCGGTGSSSARGRGSSSARRARSPRARRARRPAAASSRARTRGSFRTAASAARAASGASSSSRTPANLRSHTSK